jgi:hypothetical protein
MALYDSVELFCAPRAHLDARKMGGVKQCKANLAAFYTLHAVPHFDLANDDRRRRVQISRAAATTVRHASTSDFVKAYQRGLDRIHGAGRTSLEGRTAHCVCQRPNQSGGRSEPFHPLGSSRLVNLGRSHPRSIMGTQDLRESLLLVRPPHRVGLRPRQVARPAQLSSLRRLRSALSRNAA